MKPINFITAWVVMTLMLGCTQPDRNAEVKRLRAEVEQMSFKDSEQALAMVDSAEQAGVVQEPMANLMRTNIYGQMGQTRLAAYYGKQILHVAELKKLGDTYYSALLMLNSVLEGDGEYGNAIRLSDEIIADVDHERRQGVTSNISEAVALRVKSRALNFKGNCEVGMGHPDKAERYFLEAVSLMMDSVGEADDYWVVDAMILAVSEATEFYLGCGKAEKALPLVAKGDTALARLDRCKDVPDFVMHKRHNNVTINQALVYAANGLLDKAEALYQKHRQAEDLSVYDLVAEARYLSMTERYDEALRMFRKTDSAYVARGSAMTASYINNFLMKLYETLQKAGRKEDLLAFSNRLRHLTDSIHQREREIDVEQVETIRQKEAEIAGRRQTITAYRFLSLSLFVIISVIFIALWRVAVAHRRELIKNRELYELIQQEQRRKVRDIRRLKSQSENERSFGEQLYLKLVEVMTKEQLYTDSDLNRDMLAARLGTNHRYIDDAIRECSDAQSTKAFIDSYRVDHAAHLLANTNDSISLIAEMSGFANRTTFNEQFRNSFKMTPSEYRKASKA